MEYLRKLIKPKYDSTHELTNIANAYADLDFDYIIKMQTDFATKCTWIGLGTQSRQLLLENELAELIKQGAGTISLNTPYTNEYYKLITPLYCIIAYSNNMELIELALTHGGNLHVHGCLHALCGSIARKLSKPNDPVMKTNDPVMKIIDILLGFNCDFNYKTFNNTTPFYIFCHYLKPSTNTIFILEKIILDTKADLNVDCGGLVEFNGRYIFTPFYILLFQHYHIWQSKLDLLEEFLLWLINHNIQIDYCGYLANTNTPVSMLNLRPDIVLFIKWINTILTKSKSIILYLINLNGLFIKWIYPELIQIEIANAFYRSKEYDISMMDLIPITLQPLIKKPGSLTKPALRNK
jgi:hypothetical protein